MIQRAAIFYRNDKDYLGMKTMFDELVRISNELREAYESKKAAEFVLQEVNTSIKNKLQELVDFSNVSIKVAAANFQEVLYSYEEETYIIRHSETIGVLTAEKIEFYKLTETQSND